MSGDDCPKVHPGPFSTTAFARGTANTVLNFLSVGPTGWEFRGGPDATSLNRGVRAAPIVPSHHPRTNGSAFWEMHAPPLLHAFPIFKISFIRSGNDICRQSTPPLRLPQVESMPESINRTAVFSRTLVVSIGTVVAARLCSSRPQPFHSR